MYTGTRKEYELELSVSNTEKNIDGLIKKACLSFPKSHSFSKQLLVGVTKYKFLADRILMVHAEIRVGVLQILDSSKYNTVSSVTLHSVVTQYTYVHHLD